MSSNCTREEANISSTAIQLSFLALLLIIGAVLNFKTFFVILKQKRPVMKAVTIFLLHLTLVSGLMVVLLIPFEMSSIIKKRWIFGDVFCEINGFANVFLCSNLVFTLVCVTFDRYLSVMKPLKHRVLMTTRVAFKMLIAANIAAFLLAISPVFGKVRYKFHPGTNHCSPTWHESCPYYFIAMFLGFLVPVFGMLITYTRIILKIRSNRSKTGQRHFGISSLSNAGHSSVRRARNPRVVPIIHAPMNGTNAATLSVINGPSSQSSEDVAPTIYNNGTPSAIHGPPSTQSSEDVAPTIYNNGTPSAIHGPPSTQSSENVAPTIHNNGTPSAIHGPPSTQSSEDVAPTIYNNGTPSAIHGPPSTQSSENVAPTIHNNGTPSAIHGPPSTQSSEDVAPTIYNNGTPSAIHGPPSTQSSENVAPTIHNNGTPSAIHGPPSTQSSEDVAPTIYNNGTSSAIHGPPSTQSSEDVASTRCNEGTLSAMHGPPSSESTENTTNVFQEIQVPPTVIDEVPSTSRRSRRQSRLLSVIRNMRQNLRQEYKVARTGFLLVVTFAVLWTPYLVAHSCFNQECSTPRLFSVAMFLVYFNALANPVIYALTNKTVSRDFSVHLRKYRRGGANTRRT